MSALLRLVAWLLALALVALPVVAIMRGWIGADQWPLRQLRASGDFERVDPALVRRTLQPFARRGYFAVDLRGAQAAIAKLPWVERAEVRKHWPDTLEVRIVEHRPFAHWGRDRLLSMRGRVFHAPTGVPDGLPRLAGPDGRVAEVVQLYQQARELFAAVGLDVREVELDPRGSWSVTLLERAPSRRATRVVVGRTEARARIGRFVRLMPQLRLDPERHVVRADLRYTNGFALIWAAPPAAPRRAALPAMPVGTPATPPVPAAASLPAPVAARTRPHSPIPGLT